MTLFILEKIISYSEHNPKQEEKDIVVHNHGHEHNHSNIAISLIGDFIHNLTDGMEICVDNKNLKLGVSLSLSIFS